MDLTPEEIAEKEFDKRFALWSYDDQEVEEFLELVSIVYEEALVENKKLKEKMEDLKSTLEEEEQKIEDEKQEAAHIKEEAQKEAEKIVKEAQEEAQRIKDEAELKAERIINQSKKRVEKTINIEKKVKSDFKELLTYLLKSLESESDLEEIEDEFNQLVEMPEGEKWSAE
ncbi:MAG: DivIVA domain-containing protein [Halanaerobacter sp.]